MEAALPRSLWPHWFSWPGELPRGGDTCTRLLKGKFTKERQTRTFPAADSTCRGRAARGVQKAECSPGFKGWGGSRPQRSASQNMNFVLRAARVPGERLRSVLMRSVADSCLLQGNTSRDVSSLEAWKVGGQWLWGKPEKGHFTSPGALHTWQFFLSLLATARRAGRDSPHPGGRGGLTLQGKCSASGPEGWVRAGLIRAKLIGSA